MRLVLALTVAIYGLMVTPGVSRAVPGFCPPVCDAIPDSAWIEPSAVPLYPEYRWPQLAGLAVTALQPRFEFESWCAVPAAAGDPRDYAVAARAVAPNPPGQWNLHMQVIHWRGDVVTGGRAALQTLEKARIALSGCQLHRPGTSPSITTSEVDRIAAVISDSGRRVMRTYLSADPSSSTIVELVLWSTLPVQVGWRAVPDAQVLDAMAARLCVAYLGSCR